VSVMQKARKMERPTKFDTENPTGRRNLNGLGLYARMILKKISSTAKFLVKHWPNLNVPPNRTK
jgi:hypothetical protein